MQDNPPTPPPQPQSPIQPPVPPALKPISHQILIVGLVCLALIGIVLPGGAGAGILALAVILIGASAAIKFLIVGLRSLKNYNPIVRPFVMLGSIGVAVVIFFVSMAAGAIAALFKSPPNS